MAVMPEKLGLALSGGGHRAAFFHIGVLGALAEIGLLRQVRVLSTVSGGSLVGALYYLRLKQLLDTTEDSAITDADYVKIVRTVALEYRAAVAKNLLARVYLNPYKNFKMATRRYSRTVRMGELLEKHFYGQAWSGDRVDGQIPMRLLPVKHGGVVIDPKGKENAKRKVPVPLLLLESTCLNTGHNWRFEPGQMGEPDRQSDVVIAGYGQEDDPTDVDKNETLKSTAWDKLPEPLRNFPLGQAVAASSAFPVGFPPIQIRRLYPGVVVELSDGGVHDNQGVEGLVAESCTHIVISDASAQMQDVEKPGTWVPKVLSRVLEIYGDEEREERLLRAFADPNHAFFHLQSCLPNRVRTPGSSTLETSAVSAQSGSVGSLDDEELPYGVRTDVQKRLARMRTSLNAFSEREAWALAKDGHAIARYIVPLRPGLRKLATAPQEPRDGWPWDAVNLAEPSPRTLWLLAKGGLQTFLGLGVPFLLMAAAAAVLGGWVLVPHGGILFGITLGAFTGAAFYVLPKNRISSFLFESVTPALLALPMFFAALGLRLVGVIWLQIGRVGPG